MHKNVACYRTCLETSVRVYEYSYHRAVFHVVAFPVAQLTDGNILNTVATDAASATAAVARGVDQRHAH